MNTKIEFWEALIQLSEYTLDDNKYTCKVCGHKVNFEWAIWRHLDNKHSDKLYKLSGQAHGWNNARNGWED